MRPDDFFDWPQIGETTSQNRTNLSGVSFFTVFSQFFPYDLLFIVFQNENGQSLRTLGTFGTFLWLSRGFPEAFLGLS